jgi:hypothetical protein
MSETSGPYTGDSCKYMIQLGDIVAVRAVDWGFESEQHSADAGFTIVRGTLYGQVIVLNDEWLTVAPQVFDGGDVRCALSIPWATVESVMILEANG